MSNIPIRRWLTAVTLMASLTVTVACGQRDSASFIASAKTHLQKPDYKAAAIELRNALQKAPDDAEARFLFGKTLLETGDAAGAETELRKALDKNYPADAVYPLLARAVLAQNQSGRVVREFGSKKLGSADARAELAASLVQAQMAENDMKGARATLDAARGERPGEARLLVLDAQLTSQAGDLPAAVKLLDAAIQAAPGNSDAHLIKAQVLLAQGNNEDALKSFRKAVEVDPQSVSARFALLSMALRNADKDTANAQLKAMKEFARNDIRTNYSDAMVAYAQGEYARANVSAQQVLSRAPDHLPSLLLSGLTNLQLASYAAAEEALRKVLAKVPDEPNARRALGSVYLRTGRPSKAVEAVVPALTRYPDDPGLLRAAGEAYFASGNVAAAQKAYEHASEVDKGSIASDVRLAQMRLVTGDAKRAISDLEALSAGDAAANQADFALYAEHLRRREFAEALATLDKIEAKSAPSGTTHNLRGVIYGSMRDLKAARASFEKALALQPDLAEAAGNLATIDVQEGKPADARKRYEEVLAKDPKNERAWLALFELAKINGATQEEMKALIEKAIAANPQSIPLRAALATHHADRRDFKAATGVLQSALGVAPDEPRLLDFLGQMQIAAGDPNQALEVYKRLAKVQADNPMVQLRIANARIALKDYDGAVEAERKAIALKPDLPQAWASLAQTYMLAGRPEAAVAEARKLQKDRPKEAFGYALEGEILAVQKKWPEAAAAFRESLSRQPLPAIALGEYAALQNAGKSAEAAKFAEKWIKDNPADTVMPMYLAEQSLAAKDYPATVRRYESILKSAPETLVALNNLAWVLTEIKDPRAREYAEQAYRLAPLNPNTIDTLGWNLVQTGEAPRGTQLLRMALNLAPAQHNIRLHLAKALVQSGDKAAAKRELETLTKLDQKSMIRAEAEKLLATL